MATAKLQSRRPKESYSKLLLGSYDRHLLTVSGFIRRHEHLDDTMFLPPEIVQLIYTFHIPRVVRLTFCDSDGRIDPLQYKPRGIMDNISLMSVYVTV